MFVMLLGTIKKQQKVAEVVEAETVESEANGAEDESTTVEMNIEPQSLPENENETDQT